MTKKTITIRIPNNFLSFLTLLFIGMKLAGYINWSWVWVLAPMWITFLFFFLISMTLVIIKAFWE